MSKSHIASAANLDSEQTAYLNRNLEYVKAKSYDVKYPEDNIMSLFPVSTEAGPAAQSIVYTQYDTTGIAKFISDYADDLPMAEAKGKSYSAIIQSLGVSYGWSLQELRAAQMANSRLPERKAIAARRAMNQYINRIGWHANGSATWAGLTGIINHPNITKSPATTGAWLGGSTTPAQIIKDVGDALEIPPNATVGVEKPDTVLIPRARYSYISTTLAGTGTDTTILEFLRKTHPGVVFASVEELGNLTTNPRTGATATTHCMLVYRRSPESLTFEMPILFEQFAAQERNLSYVVPCHSRIGGFVIYYPLSVALVDGL